MITEEIRAAIQKRASTDDEWPYGVEQCWNEEIDILSKDINATIDFLEHDCTAEEFSWLSEIVDGIALLGEENLDSFGEFEVDTLYVKNAREGIKIDCILYEDDTYDEFLEEIMI